MPGLAGVLTNAVAGAIDVGRIVVPVACAGCGLEDVRWCDECAELWWQAPWRSDEAAPRLDVVGRRRLPVWSVQPLAGPAHHMVAAWKRDRRDLDEFFSMAAARLARFVAPALSLGQEIAVVPVPSRPASRRRRGVDLPLLLAGGVREGLAAAGVPARVHPCLSLGGRSARRAGASSRWRGARRDLRLTGEVPTGPVVLVDDVMTTGASLARAAALVEAAGAPTVAALTLAATVRQGGAQDVGAHVSSHSASAGARRAIVSELETSEGFPPASGR